MDLDYKIYLQKVIKSEVFSGSAKACDLFVYLFECSMQGTPPKESQIAAEVFNRNLSENDQDTTIVRVNIHNLRKKLKHYYLTEGLNDEVVFIIPTGRYMVEMTKNTTQQKPTENISTEISKKVLLSYLNNRNALIYFIVIFLSGAVSYFLFCDKQKLPSTNLNKMIIWRDFATNNKKTLVVVGDYYFVQLPDSDIYNAPLVRDFSINSDEDLVKYNTTNTDQTKKYSKARYSYTGYATPFYLKELIPILQDTDYEICLMSQFNAKYLMQYNIIFVGIYKTLGMLNLYLNYSGFYVDIRSARISVKDNAGKTENVYAQIGLAEEFHNDYAIVSKLAGPNNNIVLLVSSFHDTGIVDCVKELTNHESLKVISDEIQSKFGKIPSSFEILFKVVGVNRIDIKSKIVRINNLDSTNIFWDMK
ncbi:MAG: hypothetical protein PF489_12690 [Salinivirgaceae bacterium]|jgi:hypothetical protein|nr:hypothetical protein [Salinivirgaceae bacterium]